MSAIVAPVAADAAGSDGAASDGAASDGAAADGKAEGADADGGALDPELVVQAAASATTARITRRGRTVECMPAVSVAWVRFTLGTSSGRRPVSQARVKTVRPGAGIVAVMIHIVRRPAAARPVAILFVLVALLAACSSPGGAGSSWSFGPSLEPAASGSGAPSASAPPAAAAPAASASPSAAPSAATSASPSGATTTLTIGTKPDDELEVDPDSVEVPTGALVSVTFENRAATLPHNLTFREPIGVASSPVVAPGASETFEFTAPAPGESVFACTIHPGREGKLTVESAG